jgi:GT2 family glycosyltransferase/glycosyltransferase involved in cell wall biosynthesis
MQDDLKLFSALPVGDGVRPRPLKVCIASCEFIGPIRNGGIGTAYTAMAHALAAAGHHVTLLYTPGKQCESETIAHWESFYREQGLKFVARPTDPDLRIDAPAHALRSYETYRWLKQQEFDLIHFPEWGGDAYYSLLARHQGLAFGRTFFCIGTHSPTAWLKQANSEYYSQPRDLELDFMERRCVALADIVISPCQYMLRWMSEQGFKLPPRSFVQQNILPASARGSASAGSNAKQSVEELVFFGRLETRKGIELFCDALDRIAKEPAFRKLRITFMGKPATVSGRESRQYIHERASVWPWSCSIVSDLDQPGAMRYLKQPGRLAVIPSLMENSPYTVLECLGSKIPFLASRVGGIPELIAPEDVESATFLPTAPNLAELLRKTLQSGQRPWAPALDATANEAAWVAWHAGLAEEIDAPISASSAIATSEPPLVSVCVAHFNRPKFLKQAIASLEAQDYPNFEVLIVDDGSTSPDAIEFLASIEPKLQRNWRIIRQENRYLSAARNTGARQAKGDYLLFMDDDNFAKPNELTLFVNVARHTGADIVTSCMDYFEGAHPPDPQTRPVTRWVPLGPEPAAGYFRNCFGDANCLVKRTTFERLGGFTEIYGVTHEDWEFLANAVLKGCHLEVIPEALFHYRYTADSMIRSTSQFRNHMRHIRPYLDLVPRALHPVLLMAQGAWVEQSQGRGTQHFLSQHTLQWRSQFEAGKTLARLGHKKSAVEQLMAGLRAAEASNHPLIILEALLDIGRELRALDNLRAKDLLQLAAQLGDTIKRPEATRSARAMLADLARGNGSARRTADTTELTQTKSLRNSNAPVSIVIPTFNRLDLTRACLKAIQTHTPADQYEIVVVDNASTDGTRDFLAAEQRSGRLTAILNDSNSGFARACNQGAAVAHGKFVLFLNNDTEVKPGWLEPLIRTLETDPRVGAVGSKLIFPDATIQHAGVVILDDRKHGDPLLAQHIFHRKPQDLPEVNQPMLYQALTAASLLVRKDLFRELNGFDEDYWNGYEDVDLCFKIGASGRLLVYQPASVVVHHESQSGPERFRSAQQNIARLHNKWLKRIQPDYVLDAAGHFSRAETCRVAPYALPEGGVNMGSRRGNEADDLAGSNVSASSRRRLHASIIVLAFNQLEHTRRCLESIAAHTLEPHEVIVVDNGSTDDTPEFLKQWLTTHPNTTIIRNETNRGFAAGNNQALSIARGENVVLLNNDTVVTSGWLAGLLNVLRRHPDTGLVGPMSNNVSGPQHVPDAAYQDLAGLPAFAALWTQTHRDQSVETGRVVGFCLLARRGVIEQIGGLDEQFGSGNFEDDDLCVRARLAGFRIRIAQDVFIHHAGSQTFKGEGIDYRQAMLRNWDRFRAKWKLPADTVLERGYPVPKTLPEGVALKLPTASLTLTHKRGDDRLWREESSVEPAPKRKVELPTVARLGNLDEARSAFGRRDFASAWKAALGAMEVRPFHPEASLLLAEIALASGDAAAARQCAEFARGLAPNWKAAKQFLQKPLNGSAKPDGLQLPDPIKNQKSKIKNRLSVCLITKNEEQFLDQCLKSVQDIAHQIIVVDTGSTDRTVAIAKSRGAQVFHFDWCDDFSAARNAALEHATGDWILILDADEELPADQHEHLQADMNSSGAIGHRLPLTNAGQADGFSYVPRLFRNAPGVFYHGRIHEQVFPSLMPYCKAWGLDTRLGTTQLLHHGYAKEIVRDRNKNERNLRLLQLALAERPKDPNLVMNLGLELVRSGELPSGLEHYREAFRLMSAQSQAEIVPELREALLTQFTCHLYKVRAQDEIVRALNSPLARNGGLTASLHFALGLAHFELKQYRDAAEQMRQCIAKRKQTALSPINTDIHTAAPNHCLALSLVQLGDKIGAAKAFEAALTEKGRVEDVKLDYAKFLARQNPVDALHKLHEIVAQNAANAAAWRFGGELALQRAEYLEFACDWTSEAIRCLPDDPVILAQRAEVLLLSEQTAAAKPLWERVCNGARPPHALAAIILCAAAESEPMPETRDSTEETAASKAFLGWYQRLIGAGARETILLLNSRVDELKESLPTAAQLLSIAMEEAKQPVSA